MHFQPLRKSFGVLFTAFPDTLRAFRLLRAWQRRALLRCGSDQGCWKSKRLRRIRLLRLCEGNRGKGQHRRNENSDSGGGHAEQHRLCRDVDVVHCAHPRESEGYCAKRPDASLSIAPAAWRYSPRSAAPRRRLCCLDFHGVDVRHTTRSAFKDIIDRNLLKSRRSTERHNLSAAWAMRRPWRVFTRMFVAHGRQRSLNRKCPPTPPACIWSRR